MNYAYEYSYFLRELGGGGSNGIPPPEDTVLLVPEPRRSEVGLEPEVVEDLFPVRPGMLS